MTIVGFSLKENFKPWGQAVEVYNRIEEEGKLDKLESFFEEVYGDGIRIIDINDILSYESDSVFESLGIKDEDEEEYIKGEFESKFDKFNEMCLGRSCDCCPYFALDLEDCETYFNKVKEDWAND